MNLAKKILLAAGVVLIAIQLFRPALNKSNQVAVSDISKMFTTSDSVLSILKKSCYDCHSNNTIYPWYSNIQPMRWLMANHIRKGKKELNFSEFGSYSTRRQLSKLNGIINSISDDIMPLSSYKIMHKNKILNTNEKAQVIKWAQKVKDNLSVVN